MKRKLPAQTTSSRTKRANPDLASFPRLNPNPVGEVGLDGQIYYLNPAAQRLLPDLKTKRLTHPWLVDWESVVQSFRNRKTKSVLREVPIGERIYEQALYYVARTRRVRFYGRDITIRRWAEKGLEQSNKKLSEVLDSIQDDFYVLDRDWKFVYASKQFTGRIGKAPKDFIGNCIWEMFPKHVGTALEKNFRATMETREIRRFEIGGKYTNAWYSMTCFPSAEGITVLGTDITERKRME